MFVTLNRICIWSEPHYWWPLLLFGSQVRHSLSSICSQTLLSWLSYLGHSNMVWSFFILYCHRWFFFVTTFVILFHLFLFLFLVILDKILDFYFAWSVVRWFPCKICSSFCNCFWYSMIYLMKSTACFLTSHL